MITDFILKIINLVGSPIYMKYIVIILALVVGGIALVYTKNAGNPITQESEVIIEKELGIS